MKICIIGSGGFLSNKLVEYFRPKYQYITVIGRRKPDSIPDNFFIKLDLLVDKINLNVLLESDVIIYASALGVQSNINAQVKDIYTINSFTPIYLMEQLQEKSYKGKFVSFGSYFEIGNEYDIQKEYNEIDLIKNANLVPNSYCLSKRILTNYISFCTHSFRFYHCILPTIYGEGENPKRLIPYLINSIKENQLISMSAGYQIRQYLHIDDAVCIIERIIKMQPDSGVYNFPSAETLNIREIAGVVFNAFNKKLDNSIFGHLQRSDESMKFTKLDFSKLDETIELPILKTIKDYIQEIK